MKRNLMFAVISAVCLAALGVDAQNAFRAHSPDGLNELLLAVGDEGMSYSVFRRGKKLVGPAFISLCTKEHGRMDGKGARPKAVSRKVTGEVATSIYKKRAVDLSANETRVDFGKWAVVLHARNDGVAWRFETEFDGEITVSAENTTVRFPKGTELCYTQEGGFMSGWEKPAKIGPVSSVSSGHPQIVMTPFTASVPDAGVVTVTESNLLDYPGLNFYRQEKEEDTLDSWQAGVPNELDVGRRKIKVKNRKPYLAKTKGTRSFPWRVFVLADNPSGLVSSDIVYALAEPARIADTSWIKPGLVQWDWWHGFKITDVPGLKTGCNFETYKAYVDFAAENGIEYIIMDEGWAERLDPEKPRADVNVPGVVEYAKKKGVDVILWAAWAPLNNRDVRLRVFDWCVAIGAKGFKIDFMERDDQPLEKFLEETAADAADRKLVIMYHGIHKPTGLQRTYPNILNYEGVYGLEQGHSIGGRKVVISNDVNLVYTRMVAGFMDYTPGAMRNRAFNAPKFANGKDPSACYGTRSHQLALFPLFEAPVQMLCDSPTQYRTAPECVKFMANVPTVWDETVGVAGEINRYAAVARKKGKQWWLGAITNWEARELLLPTDFLVSGEWKVEAFEDAPDADVNAERYVRREYTIKAGDKIKVNLAPGGGFAARFTPANLRKIVLDSSKAPEYRDWAQKELLPEMEAYLPKIVSLIDGEGSACPNAVYTIVLEPKLDIPAYCSAGKVVLSMDFVRSFPHEAKGACVHELTHAVQDYTPRSGRATPYRSTPGWIVEGIADWVRWLNYEGAAGRKRVERDVQRNRKYDAGYGVSAAFLDWVAKKYNKDLIVKLNKLCRDGRYDESKVWAELTGKQLQELVGEWNIIR